ncbi:TPA: hypothetical protein MX214_002992 [Citrobacter sedlakii]|nr:hypothetical protein [Citrobacter sedlakii]HCA7136732.1 hypothetical protein [Citrobacter sedlakii]HCA7182532.1 hypothetical protein [Citrobacter sedlakii]
MLSKQTTNKLFYFACFISCLITIFLTSRFSYTWITDPDSANSPIMWKEFLSHGFSAFNNWKPTFDNWYFTVYPLNFLLFFIFNDNGFVPLMLSSAIFIMAICLCSSKMADNLSGKPAAFAALISITLISPDLYNNYYSHPFSHNSTNAFGFVVLAIYIITISSNRLLPAASVFILLVLSGASDPWILPSFTLPILIAEVYNSFINRKCYKYLAFLLLAFLTSFFNLVQHLFDLPTGEFRITTLDQMINNAQYAIVLTSKMMPLWVNPSIYTSYFIAFVWATVFTIAALVCFNRGKVLRIFSICCVLSVLGIYSSSIIGDQFPHQRFYVNVAPVVFLLISVAVRFYKSFLIPLFVTVCVSVYGYSNSPLKYEENRNPVYEYMTFLSNNNLSYGYGSFWYSMNMTVNWLSNDQIHITPVFFNPENGAVYFKPARIQTLSTWHTKEFITGKPSRQFIAITQGQTGGDTCPNVQICIDGAQKQLGTADEILSYKNTTFLVYNKPIETDIK